MMKKTYDREKDISAVLAEIHRRSDAEVSDPSDSESSNDVGSEEEEEELFLMNVDPFIRKFLCLFFNWELFLLIIEQKNPKPTNFTVFPSKHTI